MEQNLKASSACWDGSKVDSGKRGDAYGEKISPLNKIGSWDVLRAKSETFCVLATLPSCMATLWPSPTRCSPPHVHSQPLAQQLSNPYRPPRFLQPCVFRQPFPVTIPSENLSWLPQLTLNPMSHPSPTRFPTLQSAVNSAT